MGKYMDQLSDITVDAIEQVIKVADENGLDRDATINHFATVIYMISKTSTYVNYRIEKDSHSVGAEQEPGAVETAKD